MSSIGENVISFGRLSSCFFGGEGVPSVSRSSEKTSSAASTDFEGSICQSLSPVQSRGFWLRHLGGGVLVSIKEPLPHSCWT